jgi:hypothetical protein
MISLLEYIVFKNGSDGKAFSVLSTAFHQPMAITGSGYFPPIVGKGFENSLPPNNDVSVRADLRRIKWIRNLMQNNGSKKMSNKDFQQYWDDISGVRLFLNTRTCTPYTKPFIQILNSMKNENNIFSP